MSILKTIWKGISILFEFLNIIETKTVEPEKKNMSKESALNIVSTALNITPSWLNKLIQFESSWNPQAKNPLSGARGLIQFTHTTARSLGYKDADDLVSRHRDAESQLLGPVYRYLASLAPFPSAQALYMSVFYPAAKAWAVTREFPAFVTALNPGIKTVGDYISKVERSNVGKTVVILLIAAIGGYLVYSHFFKGSELWNEKRPITIVEEVTE